MELNRNRIEFMRKNKEEEEEKKILRRFLDTELFIT